MALEKEERNEAKEPARRRERLADQTAALWADPMVRLRESGGWYIERHRGFSVSFAEEYGICSFNPGCWYADAPYSLAAARKPLAPNPAIRRRGALMIPYYHRPRAPPVAFRFRSALPDEFVKRPPPHFQEDLA